jgi:hypothetical protein
MYKFKSQAASNLIMLEPNGRQILAIIGKLESANDLKGILLPEDMPTAIAALENAVAQDEARRALLARQAQEKGEVLAVPEGVTLKLRALPFIEMIKRCLKANKEIVWGV